MNLMDSALKRESAESLFNKNLKALKSNNNILSLESIDLIRHKPEKRFLIKYLINIKNSDSDTGQKLSVLGKSRLKGLDVKTYEVIKRLWSNGFGPAATDNIEVPEPVGMIPELNMWLQKKIDGRSFFDVLREENSSKLCKQISLALIKLSKYDELTKKTHSISDELSILKTRLDVLANEKPQWSKDINKIMEDCIRLSEKLDDKLNVTIHRDFYHDQILIDGKRLYVLDLDLFTKGSPYLDMGNFNAHLTEYGLRNYGNPDYFIDTETKIKSEYIDNSLYKDEQSIEIFKIISLARHISISANIKQRREFTEDIIDLCRQQIDKFIYH